MFHRLHRTRAADRMLNLTALCLACIAITVGAGASFQQHRQAVPAQFDQALIERIVHLNALKTWQEQASHDKSRISSPFENGALVSPPINAKTVREHLLSAITHVARENNVLLMDRRVVFGADLPDYTDAILSQLNLSRADESLLMQALRQQAFAFPEPSRGNGALVP